MAEMRSLTDPLWQAKKSQVDDTTERWRVFDNQGSELSTEQVFLMWKGDERFRAFWTASLREVPLDSYCWECPAMTGQVLSRPFECVFLSSPLLAAMPPDPRSFAGYFRPGCDAVTFESLGGDAMLVAPCPEEGAVNFAHLASFTATASQARQDALWQAIGKALDKRIGSEPTWLSTAGLGVAWLHVRLDTRPKYYRFAPYRDQLLR